MGSSGVQLHAGHDISWNSISAIKKVQTRSFYRPSSAGAALAALAAYRSAASALHTHLCPVSSEEREPQASTTA